MAPVLGFIETPVDYESYCGFWKCTLPNAPSTPSAAKNSKGSLPREPNDPSYRQTSYILLQLPI